MARPLVIHVAPEWREHEKIKELEAKGHTIIAMDGAYQPDLIIHPAGWAWTEAMWDYLDIAVKAARKGKYGDQPKAS